MKSTWNSPYAPCDDSPQFTNTAIPYVCAGYPISYSYGAYDPAGDSLTYTFISAMNTGAVNLPYVAGFSGTEPITGITLDPHSGQVNFTLNQTGNWVVVVRVDQYDENGNWIGSVMRDMQFIAYPCTNIPPDPATGIVDNLSGLATQTGPRAIEICESGDFCFDAVITDANANNVITATCMLGYSIAVGIENGWLDESEWGTRLESAWAGVKLHIATDGKTLMNVCTGTGKQPTLEDYYEREAILGPDSRGGAMAMLFAAEMKRR